MISIIHESIHPNFLIINEILNEVFKFHMIWCKVQQWKKNLKTQPQNQHSSCSKDWKIGSFHFNKCMPLQGAAMRFLRLTIHKYDIKQFDPNQAFKDKFPYLG